MTATLLKRKPYVRKDVSSFHITYFPPNDVWPIGGWSVYQITGDEIASRVVKDEKGAVTERHSWCGFLGIAATLEGVAGMVKETAIDK